MCIDMLCHECGIEVEPFSYPEGECPECGLTYTLPDSAWDWYQCPDCENEMPSRYCIDCGNWLGE